MSTANIKYREQTIGHLSLGESITSDAVNP